MYESFINFPLTYMPHGKTQTIKSVISSPTAQGPDLKKKIAPIKSKNKTF